MNEAKKLRLVDAGSRESDTQDRVDLEAAMRAELDAVMQEALFRACRGKLMLARLKADSDQLEWLIRGKRGSRIWDHVFEVEQKQGHNFVKEVLNVAIASQKATQ